MRYVLSKNSLLMLTHIYRTVKCAWLDQGEKFTSEDFGYLLIQNQTKHGKSVPYSPHQSSTVERAWRTLFEMFRCLLLQSGLPKTCTYAVMTAAYICNRWYNPRTKTTPFQSFTGRKSNIALPVMPTYKIPRNWMAEVRKVSVLVMIRKVQLIWFTFLILKK